MPPLPSTPRNPVGMRVGQRSAPQLLIQRAHNPLQLPARAGRQKHQHALDGIPGRRSVIEVPSGAGATGGLHVQISPGLGQEPPAQPQSGFRRQVQLGVLILQMVNECSVTRGDMCRIRHDTLSVTLHWDARSAPGRLRGMSLSGNGHAGNASMIHGARRPTSPTGRQRTSRLIEEIRPGRGRARALWDSCAVGPDDCGAGRLQGWTPPAVRAPCPAQRPLPRW